MNVRRKAVCCLTLILALALRAVAADGVVVANEYENFDSAALTNAPVTFSRIGADGDFTRGITPRIHGKKLPAQVDVLRKAPDGSIRHALVSFVLPRLPAGGSVRIDWLNEKPVTPPAFVWGFDRAAFAAKLVLTSQRGGKMTSDLGRILAGRWGASPRVKVLHDGPVMKELEVHDVPVDAAGKADSQLDVYWRVRAFTGLKSVRVEAVVERCKERVRGRKVPVQYKFRSVELQVDGKGLCKAGPFDHMDQTRYRMLVWTAGAAEDIHRRPNYDYWVKGRFVPQYRWTSPMTPQKVDATFTRPTHSRPALKRPQGILENGIIITTCPARAGGGR